jgi:hypothetical protein
VVVLLHGSIESIHVDMNDFARQFSLSMHRRGR